MKRNKSNRLIAILCAVIMMAEQIWGSGLYVSAAEETDATTVAETQQDQTEEAEAEQPSAEDAAPEAADETAPEAAEAEEPAAEEPAEDTPAPVIDQDDEDVIVSEESSDTTEAEADDEVAEVDVEEDVDEQAQEEANNISNEEGQLIVAALTAYINGSGELTVPTGEQLFDTIKQNTGKEIYELLTIGALVFDGTFENNTDIKRLIIPEECGVTIIGARAFKGCTNLEYVDFSACSSLNTLRSSCFEGCTKLTTVKFNDKLKEIDEYAFKQCKFDTIDFNNGIISTVKNGAFYESGVKTVKMSPRDISFSGKAFEKCAISQIVFPENGSAKVIPAYMFNGAGFEDDVTINIPYYVTEIKEKAFAESNIKGINIQTGGTLNRSDMTTVGKSAFYKCEKLTQFGPWPTLFQKIQEKTFSGCIALTSLTIPNTVDTIGSEAFSNCTGLTTLVLSNNTNADGAIGDKAFYKCSNLVNVTVPENLKQIGVSEFEMCGAIQTIVLPESIEKIGKAAFKSCVALKTINIPSQISKIEAETFKACDALTTADMPETVTVIDNEAFYGCNSYRLKGAGAGTCGHLPRDLKAIGSKAFYNNDSFVGELVIPANVTEIHEGAFYTCELINAIRFEGYDDIKCDANPANGIFGANTNITKITFPETQITSEGKKEYKKIPAWLFAKCGFPGINELVIPETVDEIGDGAFAGFYSETTPDANMMGAIKFANRTNNNDIKIGKYAFRFCNAITTFVLPGTDTNGKMISYEIQEGAFCYCSNIGEITIPEGVTILGKEVFKGCSNLGIIRYNAIDLQDSGPKKDKTEEKDFKDRNRFLGCNIQSIFIGENVRTFPDYLFEGGQYTNPGNDPKKLVTITIPASTERIGAYALPNVINLGTLEISEGSKLKTIGTYAFKDCINLSTIKGNLPDTIVEIGNYAFRGCEKLGLNDEEFHIPTGLTFLGDGAFENCYKIRKVVIPAGVTSIRPSSFKDNVILTSVTMEGPVETIGEAAFEGCELLKVLRLPNGVEKVDQNAFAGCGSLDKVYVPQSVTTIGTNAFTTSANAVYYVTDNSEIKTWLTGKVNANYIHTYKYRVDYVLKKGKNAPFNTYGFDSDNEKATDQYAYDQVLNKGIGINGSTFVDWYLDAEFTKKVTEVKAEQAKDNLITIYSDWVTTQYPIEYVLRGGVNDPENPPSYDMFTDPIKLKNPTYPVPEGSKAKISFQGWYEDLEDKTTLVKEIKGEDMRAYVLYAKWSNESAKPTASIASGSKVVKGTKLKLYSNGAIYYTEDGTIPSSDDTSGRTKTYSGGITINGKIKIRAIALETDKTDSLPATFEYSLLEESEYWGEVDEEDQQEMKAPDKVPAGIWIGGVPEWVPYTGEAVVFDDIRVYDHKIRLIEGVDYTVKYKNNKKAAEYSDAKAPSVIIKGKGSYNGSYAKTFSIRVVTPVTSEPGAVAIKKAQITVNPAVVYDWNSLSANAVGLKVNYGGKNLEEGKDYICAFSKKKVGKATVTVIGIKGFKGKVKKKFNITPADLSKTVNTKVYPLDEAGNEISGNNATGTVAYQKGGVQPKVSVYYKGKKLVEGVHYKPAYSGNEKVGTAKVTAEGKGNFTNKAAAVSYKVVKGNVSDLNIGVSGIKASSKFAAIKKGTLTVLDVNGKLLSGKADDKLADYEVKWVYLDGNEQETLIDGKTKGMLTAGTKIRVYITGKNNYSGTRMIESKVYTSTIAKAKVKIPAQQFTGRAVEPDANTVAVSVKGNSLIVDKDFTIVGYGPNVKAGSVKVYLAGKEGYGGLKTAKFKITKKKMIQN